MLGCWPVYYLVRSDCSGACLSFELQMFDQEAIVETTNERTAIDSKCIITVLPHLKLAGAK